MDAEGVFIVLGAGAAGIAGGATGAWLVIWGLNKVLDARWGKDTRA
jgi:hypothetical protein